MTTFVPTALNGLRANVMQDTCIVEPEGAAAVEAGEVLADDGVLLLLAVSENLVDSFDLFDRVVYIFDIAPYRAAVLHVAPTAVGDVGKRGKESLPAHGIRPHIVEKDRDRFRRRVPEKLAVLLHPSPEEPRVCEEELLPSEHRLTGYLEKGRIPGEELPVAKSVQEVIAASFEAPVKVVEVVVAQEQGHALGILLLEPNNIQEVVESLRSIDSLVRIRIEIVAEEDDMLISAVVHH